MSLTQLVLRYGFFAIIATLCNLGTQRLAFALAPDSVRFWLALIAGTGVGLVVKYVLDKKWIFGHVSRAVSQETKTFSLYTLTGVVTTLVFWGMEAAFWWGWQTQAMRELGAVIGLGIGYVVKYNLDRRFVFKNAA